MQTASSQSSWSQHSMHTQEQLIFAMLHGLPFRSVPCEMETIAGAALGRSDDQPGADDETTSVVNDTRSEASNSGTTRCARPARRTDVMKRPAAAKRPAAQGQHLDPSEDNKKSKKDERPEGPKDNKESFAWAHTYLGRAALKYGRARVEDQLKHHSWSLDELFAGVGSAHILCKMLESAARNFAGCCSFDAHGGVLMESNTIAQKILLSNTSDRCLFGDVNAFRECKSKHSLFPKIQLRHLGACKTHAAQCLGTCGKSVRKLRVLAMGPPCVMFSKSGKNERFDDPRIACHHTAFQMASDWNYDIVIVENVCGYPMLEQVSKLGKFSWRVSVSVDPRRFGYNMGRERSVAVGLNSASMMWLESTTLDDMLQPFEAHLAEKSIAKMFFLMPVEEIRTLYGHWYDVEKPCVYSLPTTCQNALQQYSTDAKYSASPLWDLVELPDHERARIARVDGSVFTFKTNSGYCYSSEKERILFPEEILNAMGVPVFRESAASASVPLFELRDNDGKHISFSAKVTLGGNGCPKRLFKTCWYLECNRTSLFDWCTGEPRAVRFFWVVLCLANVSFNVKLLQRVPSSVISYMCYVLTCLMVFVYIFVIVRYEVFWVDFHFYQLSLVCTRCCLRKVAHPINGRGGFGDDSQQPDDRVRVRFSRSPHGGLRAEVCRALRLSTHTSSAIYSVLFA